MLTHHSLLEVGPAPGCDTHLCSTLVSTANSWVQGWWSHDGWSGFRSQTRSAGRRWRRCGAGVSPSGQLSTHPEQDGLAGLVLKGQHCRTPRQRLLHPGSSSAVCPAGQPGDPMGGQPGDPMGGQPGDSMGGDSLVTVKGGSLGGRAGCPGGEGHGPTGSSGSPGPARSPLCCPEWSWLNPHVCSPSWCWSTCFQSGRTSLP